MKNLAKKQPKGKDQPVKAENAKVKTNQYTPEEKKFADGEGSKLDNVIDIEVAKPEKKEA